MVVDGWKRLRFYYRLSSILLPSFGARGGQKTDTVFSTTLRVACGMDHATWHIFSFCSSYRRTTPTENINNVSKLKSVMADSLQPFPHCWKITFFTLAKVR
jgi:hypothetical protein